MRVRERNRRPARALLGKSVWFAIAHVSRAAAAEGKEPPSGRCLWRPRARRRRQAAVPSERPPGGAVAGSPARAAAAQVASLAGPAASPPRAASPVALEAGAGSSPPSDGPPLIPIPPRAAETAPRRASSEAVDLDQVLLHDLLLDKKLGHVFALVALQLDHL